MNDSSLEIFQGAPSEIVDPQEQLKETLQRAGRILKDHVTPTERDKPTNIVSRVIKDLVPKPAVYDYTLDLQDSSAKAHWEGMRTSELKGTRLRPKEDWDPDFDWIEFNNLNIVSGGETYTANVHLVYHKDTKTIAIEHEDLDPNVPNTAITQAINSQVNMVENYYQSVKPEPKSHFPRFHFGSKQVKTP